MILFNGLTKREIVDFMLRFLLGVVFATTGFSKAASLPDFVVSINSYDIIPDHLISAFAILTISFEIAFGLSVALGLFTRSSSAILSAMLLLFLIGMTMEVIRGNNADCGCFGAFVQEKIGVGSIIRDSLLLSVAIWISLERRHRWSIDQFIRAKYPSQTR